MSGNIPPAAILIVGALLVPLIKGKLKQAYLLLLPVLVIWLIINLPDGKSCAFTINGFDIILNRVDKLSLIFGYIFTLITFIAILFALKVKDDLQHAAALVYAGGALGVTFAGDVFSLYVFWEMMSVASTFLILARRTKASQDAAFRYVMVHIVGGLCLLAGIILYVHERGTTEFSFIGLNGLSSWLIFFGIAVNAAIPPLHVWLKDAYPNATVTGAVFMSALTTKSAVYLMARTFPGTELLIWLGAIMTIYPIFFAVIENDLRRVLSYSLVNQVGFMMVGIGIGTQLSLNGTVSHAFCHILYKALLFMSVGSVLHMTGKIKCTELGGIYKTMPITAFFCIIGAASISAFPLFSGFVSKSMIISAAGHEKLIAIWIMLQFASAGVLHHAGIKVPFFAFFGKDSGIRVKEPPLNMLIAMGIAAFFCVFLAVCPNLLYSILPYPVDYIPYTASHVVGQLQLLLFAALAFVLFTYSGLHPAEVRAANMDFDWFYRKGGRLFYNVMDWGLNGFNRLADKYFMVGLTGKVCQFAKHGLANIVVAGMTPYFIIDGTDQPNRDATAAKIRNVFSRSLFPIGLIVIPVVIYLCLLLIL
ncbi:MAG: Na(+)/H(+) antiporter subunit D [Calditrichaeota bacterium]|nr:Na(+)/H(+) antiporter subunit D [Calditrichota bacterium]